jgi:hypothetical protein
MSRPLRRIGDPVVAAGPPGVPPAVRTLTGFEVIPSAGLVGHHAPGGRGGT